MSSYELERLKTLIQGENDLDEPNLNEIKSEIRSAELFLFEDAIKRMRPDDE